MFKTSNMRAFGLHVLGLVVFGILYLSTGPDILRSPHSLFADGGDTLIAISLMSWVNQCFATFGCNISDFPIFYPEKGVLFFTEHMIGMAIIYGLFVKLVGEFHYAYNLTIIAFDVANYYSMFLFLRFLRVNYVGAFLAGASFATTPYLLQYLPHIHLHPLFLWPIALMALSKFIETTNARWTYAIAALVAFQLYFAVSLGIMLAFIVVVIFIIGVLSEKFRLVRNFMTNPLYYFIHMGGVILLFYVLVYPLADGYSQIQKQHDFTRALYDSIPYSLDALAIPVHLISKHLFDVAMNLQPPLNIQHLSQAWLIGFTPFAALLMFGLMARLASGSGSSNNIEIDSRLNFWKKTSVISALLTGSLMLGPVLVIAGHATKIPLPYSLFYGTFPGFSAMRVPVRFIIPFSFFLAIILGIVIHTALEYLVSKAPSRRKVLPMIVIMVVLGAFVRDRVAFNYPNGVPATHFKTIPKVYDFIKDRPGSPVLELPLWPPSAPTFAYFYYQMFDWSPRLGGISSFFPASFFRLRDDTANCPSENCFKRISESTAEYLIVHLNHMDEDARKRWDVVAHDFLDFNFVGKIDGALLWSRVNKRDTPLTTLKSPPR